MKIVDEKDIIPYTPETEVDEKDIIPATLQDRTELFAASHTVTDPKNPPVTGYGVVAPGFAASPSVPTPPIDWKRPGNAVLPAGRQFLQDTIDVIAPEPDPIADIRADQKQRMEAIKPVIAPTRKPVFAPIPQTAESTAVNTGIPRKRPIGVSGSWEPEGSYGIVKEVGRQLLGGVTDVEGAAGLGMEAAGRFIESMGKPGYQMTEGESFALPLLDKITAPAGAALKEVGKKYANYWGDEGDKYQQSTEIQGNVIANPRLLANPKWWASNIARMSPGMGAALLTAVATGGAATGNFMGGVMGGLMEGQSTRRQGLQQGMTEDEAISAGTKMALASGILNAIGIDKMLNPGGQKTVARFLIAGTAEGLTESAEEPAEGAIFGEDWHVFKERVNNMATVFPIAFVTGGAGSLAAGGLRTAVNVRTAPGSVAGVGPGARFVSSAVNVRTAPGSVAGVGNRGSVAGFGSPEETNLAPGQTPGETSPIPPAPSLAPVDSPEGEIVPPAASGEAVVSPGAVAEPTRTIVDPADVIMDEETKPATEPLLPTPATEPGAVRTFTAEETNLAPGQTPGETSPIPPAPSLAPVDSPEGEIVPPAASGEAVVSPGAVAEPTRTIVDPADVIMDEETKPQEPMKLYHGTSAPEFTQFGKDFAYLTDNQQEAGSFADSPILGGGRGTGNPRVLDVTAKPGAIKDIDSEIQDGIMNEIDPDDVIKSMMPQLKKEGVRYVSFYHPGATTEDEFKAIVSLYPKNDLTVNPSITEKGVPNGQEGQTQAEAGLLNATQGAVETPPPVVRPDGGYDRTANKSNRAMSAEDAGLKNASETAKVLNVSPVSVKLMSSPVEWHHAGTNYQKVHYYAVEGHAGADVDPVDYVDTGKIKAFDSWYKTPKTYTGILYDGENIPKQKQTTETFTITGSKAIYPDGRTVKIVPQKAMIDFGDNKPVMLMKVFEKEQSVPPASHQPPVAETKALEATAGETLPGPEPVVSLPPGIDATTDLFIRGKVKTAGSLDAAKAVYSGKSAVDEYGRKVAEEVWGKPAVTPQEPAAPPQATESAPVEVPDYPALYDEAQDLIQKIPNNTKGIPRKLSPLNQQRLTRLDEIEKIMPSTSPEWKAQSDRGRANWEKENSARIQKISDAETVKMRDKGYEIGDKVSFYVPPLFPGAPETRYEGTVRQNKSGQVIVKARNMANPEAGVKNLDLFRNPWSKAEAAKPAEVVTPEPVAPPVFIRALTATEQKSVSLRNRAMRDMPEKEGHEAAYKPYGKQGAGIYYVPKKGVVEAPVASMVAEAREPAPVAEKPVAPTSKGIERDPIWKPKFRKSTGEIILHPKAITPEVMPATWAISGTRVGKYYDQIGMRGDNSDTTVGAYGILETKSGKTNYDSVHADWTQRYQEATGIPVTDKDFDSIYEQAKQEITQYQDGRIFRDTTRKFHRADVQQYSPEETNDKLEDWRYGLRKEGFTDEDISDLESETATEDDIRYAIRKAKADADEEIGSLYPDEAEEAIREVDKEDKVAPVAPMPKAAKNPDATIGIFDLTDSATGETIPAGTAHYILNDGRIFSEDSYSKLIDVGAQENLFSYGEVKAENKTKEPWEMTRDEYLDAVKSGKVRGDEFGVSQHERLVFAAIKKNFPVPYRVLREYPDLFKKYSKKPTESAPAEDNQTSMLNGEEGITGQHDMFAEKPETPAAEGRAGTLSPSTARTLLSLPGEQRRYPSGDHLSSLREQIIAELMGEKVPKSKADAMAVESALKKASGMEHGTFQEYLNWLKGIAESDEPAFMSRPAIPGEEGYVRPVSPVTVNPGRESHIQDFLYSTKDTPSTQHISGSEVMRTVDSIASKFNVPVKVVPTTADLPGEIRDAAMRRQSGGDVVLGIYHGGKVYIVAEHMRSRMEAQKVFIHEATGHYGLRKVMGKDFEDFLDFLINDTKYGTEINVFAEKNGIDDPRVAADEWFAQQSETARPSLWNRFMAVGKAFLARLGVKWEFSKTELAELLRKAREAAVKGGVVEGQGMGYATRKQTDTPEFKKWFGKSKVVDGQGEPLVVYHGSKEKFTVFDRSKLGKNTGQASTRQWFHAGDKETAMSYHHPKDIKEIYEKYFNYHGEKLENEVKKVLDGGSFHELYLRIENPLIVDTDGYDWEAHFDSKDALIEYYKEAEEKGNDGIIFYNVPDNGDARGDYKSTVYAFKNPAQVKSATGNIGTFDAANPDIRFATRPASQCLELPEETQMQWFQRMMQDKLNRLEQVQGETPVISEATDAYMKSELYIGRATERVKEFDKEIVSGKDSFLSKLTDSGFTISELDMLLYAEHAKERNAYIATINKKLPEAGSGMSNKVSKAIIAAADPALVQFAKEFRNKVTRAALQLRLDEGLITQETYDTLDSFYQNYVPLKGKAGKESYRRIGKGFSVTGKDIIRAHGRRSMADSPVVQAIMDMDDAIVRAEKNKVMLALRQLVLDNPGEFWHVEKLQYLPKYDKDGNIEYMDPRYKYDPEAIEVKVEGKTEYVMIQDKALVEGLKNMGAGQGIKILSTVNNYLRAVNTIYSPEFIITNFERDIQTAIINIGGEKSANISRKMVKDVPAAMRGIYRNVRDKKKPNTWVDLYTEFKEVGGRIGWMDMDSIEERSKKLEKQVRDFKSPNGLRQTVKAVGEYMDNMNEVVESGVRLSAYKQLRDAGVSKEKAAQYAKNLTVNFNKKGQWGTVLNTLYLFSNASIQGSTRILESLKKPRVQAIVAGMMVSSLLVGLLNRWRDEDSWDQVTGYTKDTNWLVPLTNGKYVAFRVPYGYNIFHVLGNVTEEYIFGNLSLPEAGARMMKGMLNAFNPLGGASLFQMLSPTIIDPLAMAAENKSFMGTQLHPEQAPYQPFAPKSSLFTKGNRDGSVFFSQWLNRITGGNETLSGKVDLYPAYFDLVLDTIGGGVSRSAADLMQTGITFAKADIPELNHIPIARQFVKTPSQSTAKSIVYDMAKESERHIFSENQTARFYYSLRLAEENGSMSREQIRKVRRGFEKNQKSAIKSRGDYSPLQQPTPESESEPIKRRPMTIQDMIR